MPGKYHFNGCPLFFNFKCSEIKEQANVFFSIDHLQLFLIFVVISRLGVTSPEWSNFIDHISQLRVGIEVDPSSKVHPNF
ncbi:hypothetical protein SDC9_143780 [bioreactor metagenome]|uniref:Uncharacterized protein n=1 Tax=bioreactor metagenome TaxID=1076179 RepID=A0A645E532_9ZZZZ